MELYIDYVFNEGCKAQFQSFFRGFHRVCSGQAFAMLQPEELENLICGSKKLDFGELEKVTIYQDGFTKDSLQIQWLWEVLHTFDETQKKKFLSFCTGCDRAPVGGLGNMRLFISKHGADSEILPSAHTCFNHLLIPEYTSKEKLSQKLTLAIENSEGFGLI